MPVAVRVSRFRMRLAAWLAHLIDEPRFLHFDDDGALTNCYHKTSGLAHSVTMPAPSIPKYRMKITARQRFALPGVGSQKGGIERTSYSPGIAIDANADCGRMRPEEVPGHGGLDRF